MRWAMVAVLMLAGCAEGDGAAGLGAMGQQMQLDQIRRQQQYQALQQARQFQPVLVQPVARPKAWGCC